MLSRHFLRAKSLQTLYAGVTANRNYEENELLGAEEKQHITNPTDVEQLLCSNVMLLNDLSITQLSTLPQLTWTVERIQENAQQKFNPSEEERNPSRCFVDNQFIARLENIFEFKQQTQRLHIDWSNNFDIFRKVWNTLRNTTQYNDYIKMPQHSFDDDKSFALLTFKALMNEETLRALIYERELLWEDDFDQIAQYNFMMLKEFTADNMNEASPCPIPYDDRKEKDRIDFEFARQLTVNTYNHIDDVEPLIKKHLQNWDFDRVALIDILMINMAVTEFTRCPSIPERVTVDEYIELSKDFSTSKSKLFINGILDKILIELRVAGKINKDSRGLYDPNFDTESVQS